MSRYDRHQSKPKLLVILGAGSSVVCEMPSVSDINKEMKLWSRKYLTSLPDQHEVDIFKELWEMVTCYYGTNHYGIRPKLRNGSRRNDCARELGVALSIRQPAD